MAGRLGGGWAAVVVWIAMQLTLTSLPGGAIPIGIPHPLDWAGHFFLYAGLGCLVARVGALNGWPRRRLFIAMALIGLGAALDEVHQLFVPGRDAEVSDWVSDTLGAIAGLTLGVQLMKSRWQRWLR
jgi:VanZ family protein